MVAALCLGRQGIPVLLLEAQRVPHDHRRATTFHPPTLEYLAEFGVVDAVLDNGRVTPVWQFRDRRAGCIAEFDLDLLKDETPYPFRVQCEQFNLNHALARAVRELDHVELRMGMRVTGATQTIDDVTVAAESDDGKNEQFTGQYLIAADGARSVLRSQLGVPFEGFTYELKVVQYGTTFDVQSVIPDIAGVAYISDPEEWCVLLHLPDYWRMTFSSRPDERDEVALGDDVAQARMEAFLGAPGATVALHRNVWRIHQRVAADLRHGRILLAGDAAHINSPMGGMGMNSGVHDAVNLSEKLGRIWRAEAAPDTLDRYSRQRRHVALEDVHEQSVRNTRFLYERDPETRARRHEEFRATAADRDKARAFLMRSSMIAGLRQANAME